MQTTSSARRASEWLLFQTALGLEPIAYGALSAFAVTGYIASERLSLDHQQMKVRRPQIRADFWTASPEKDSFLTMRTDRLIRATYLGLFLSGIASAAAVPYQSTIGLDVLRLSGSAYSVIVLVSGILAVAMSLWIGWLSDRYKRRSVFIVLISMVACIGIFAFTLFGGTALFVLCCVLFLPLASILTQQCFAYLRFHSKGLDHQDVENRNAAGRTAFASAWVLAPLIFVVIPTYDQANLAFGTSALACGACAVLFLFPIHQTPVPDQTATNAAATDKTERWRIPRICLMLSIPLLGCGALRAAPRLQQILLGPIIVNEFGGTIADVGNAAALAAGIELPLILVWGRMLRFMSRPTMLLVGSLLFAAYFVALYLSHSMSDVYASATLLALATSGTLSITISYLQSLLPAQPGLGSSLVSVANCLGAAIAALSFAPFAEGELRSGALVAAVVAVIGGFAVWSWSKRFYSSTVMRIGPGRLDGAGG